MTERPNTTFSRLTIVLSFFLIVAQTGFAQNPVANFSATPLNGCSPLAVQFTDQSSGAPFSWNWDFGNGQLSTVQNPSVTYTVPGTYTVRLVVRNANGIDEEIKTNYIVVSPSPNAAFTANLTTACAPATIQFTDLSTVPAGAGTIVSWLWDFGDGNTSTQQNPSHTYTTNGFYNITLIITSSSGCQSTASIGRYIRIVSGIDVNFLFTEASTCQAPFLINFSDQSSGPGNLSYSWNFNNGGPGSTLANPSNIVFNAPGTYAVTLNVQSDLGCSGTITKDVTITGKTTAFTYPSTICIGQAVTFQNTSSPAPVSSSWDFGDGTTSAQINPTKTFLTSGTFPVKLVNDYGNCVDSITQNVTVIGQPAVDFMANDSSSCTAPFTVQFTDLSPTATTWFWTFGDGGTSTQQNPSHTYTTGGLFNVTLTITLPGGCTNTITKPQFIQIRDITMAIANAPAGGCIPFTFSPVPAVQSVDNVVSWLWDMGEPGATYTTQFPTHTYTTAGNFTITLTVTTQNGCTETYTLPNGVRTGIRPTVNFSFTPNNTCASTPVQFTDLSVTTPGALVQWDWHFGDGLTSPLQNPEHQYIDTGMMTVTLIVSNNGCLDSAKQTIQVLPPVANFEYTVDCNNRLRVIFRDTSLVNPIYGPITYEWRMGDPANTVFFGLPAPTFTYPAYGTYSVTLIVTNGACSYETTRSIVLTDESPGFTISKNPVCRDEAFTLTATGINPANIREYTWTIGTNVITTTTPLVSYSLAAYGSYDVTLSVEDINGCTSSVTIPNYITVTGPLANFSNGPGACVNRTITFNDLSTPVGGINQWTWNFGDGGGPQTFSAPPFTHSYAETGSYTVSLAVRDNANCIDVITVPNAVVITSPKAGFRADTIYCPLAPLQFVDTSSGSGLTYRWEFGDGGISNLQNPTHSYALGDNQYTVKLVVTDLVGCTDSVTKSGYIRIRSPKAAFDIQDTAGVCLPLVTSFTFRGADYERFYWDFGDGTGSQTMNPSHFYNTYGSFTPKLYLIGPGGCIDSAEATVNTYDPAVHMNFTYTNAVACNTLTTDFNLTVPAGFKFHFSFGDGTIDSSQSLTLNHTYTTPGIYAPRIVVFDKFGCYVIRNNGIITVYGALPLFGKDKDEFCDAAEVFFVNYTLSNDPVASINWSFGDGGTSTQEQPSHLYSGAGTYIVRLTVTTQNSCTSEFTDTVRVYATPVLSIVARDTVCINSTERFVGVVEQADSTLTWQWNLGNGNSQIQNPTVTYTTAGNFNVSLIAKNKLDCADTATHSITVVDLPTATPVASPLTMIAGTSTQLNMNYTGPIVSYTWIPSQRMDCPTCPAPVVNPQFSTDYRVTVTDRYGCRNTGDISVQVICTGQNFFMPNTFSPNGDGSNDVFYPRGTGVFRIKSFRIFNRWGEVVFERREFPVNDAAAGWNGMYKGKKASSDVYVYQLEILCSNGELIRYSGDIALIQ